ncbi:Alkaline phosphatase family protein [Rhodovastum atsumiense]|uniref:Alkaline phosphatase family protein n=1 Tax=Rhodovastum atsumiense TaxID=504468 RepID=A0A5M6ISE6_9PROT|nr:alkaline phosphatase family protein [Rhodovastum atsumiense]KAA5610395.1 alkaline phosphatase family protein [Rhodovastum atsumiense]CAH2602926.1 Alkaline phosphatase family protein [Rhodovastum atsumiense]
MTRRAVVVVLDGLRRDLLSREATPALADFADVATHFTEHRSVFPSATRCASASFATGCFPARHGLQGNTVALMEQDGLVVHDVGPPGFMAQWRRLRGRTLAVPTLAERLARAGREAMLFSNVSPGAALAHDPDGFGWVFHRACSHAPGPRALRGADAVADITPDCDGDTRLTDRFITQAVAGNAALGVLWLGEPDHTQHEAPLGAPACRAAIAAADACFARVRDAVQARRAAGEDILLIACSDHGHQTVTEVIDIDGALEAAGLGDSVAVAANGTAVLVYLHPARAARTEAVIAFLRAQPWAGEVVAGTDLARIGQAPAEHLLCAVSLRADDLPNAFGVPGRAAAARPTRGKPDRLGCGQHGGLGRFEQMPFLMIDGPGFHAGKATRRPSRIVDLAPTILRHLGLPETGCDGHALQHQEL